MLFLSNGRNERCGDGKNHWVINRLKMKWTTWLCRLLPICVCSSRNQSTADRWINKTNYKLAALSTFAFRFSMNRKRFAAHHVWECVCLYLFYLYLIIINCIQTSLLWDANKETTTLVTCIENVPAAYPLSLSFSTVECIRIWILCVCRFIDCVFIWEVAR